MAHKSVLKDFAIVGTPLRGLVLRGPFSLCAYLGVPQQHWLADIDDLEFPCHWGVTFRQAGDGALWPAGWFWFGWDYGHAGDFIDVPDEIRVLEDLLPPEMRKMLNGGFLRKGKNWTVEEVEHDLVDAALSLNETLENARLAATQVGNRLKASTD